MVCMMQISRVVDICLRHFRSGWKFCPSPKLKFIVDLKKKKKETQVNNSKWQFDTYI